MTLWPSISSSLDFYYEKIKTCLFSSIALQIEDRNLMCNLLYIYEFIDIYKNNLNDQCKFLFKRFFFNFFIVKLFGIPETCEVCFKTSSWSLISWTLSWMLLKAEDKIIHKTVTAAFQNIRGWNISIINVWLYPLSPLHPCCGNV